MLCEICLIPTPPSPIRWAKLKLGKLNELTNYVTLKQN